MIYQNTELKYLKCQLTALQASFTAAENLPTTKRLKKTKKAKEKATQISETLKSLKGSISTGDMKYFTKLENITKEMRANLFKLQTHLDVQHGQQLQQEIDWVYEDNVNGEGELHSPIH